MPTIQISSEIVFNQNPEDTSISLSGTIGLSADGFSFVSTLPSEELALKIATAVYDPSASEYERAAGLKEFLIQSNIQNCQLYAIPDCFMAIPSSIAGIEDEHLFDIFQTRASNTQILKEDLPWFSSVLLSVISDETKRIALSDNIFQFSGSLVYNWIEGIVLSGNNTGVFVHVNANNFWILILKESKLQLLNAFPYAGMSDFVYYLLGAIHNCPDFQGRSLYVSGSIMPSSTLWQTLNSHFDIVSPMNPANIKKADNHNPLHLIFPLIK